MKQPSGQSCLRCTSGPILAFSHGRDASSFSYVGSGATGCVFPGKSTALACSGQLTRPHELPSDGIYHEAVGRSMTLMGFIDEALCWRWAAPEASSEVRTLACGKPHSRLSGSALGKGRGGRQSWCGRSRGLSSPEMGPPIRTAPGCDEGSRTSVSSPTAGGCSCLRKRVWLGRKQISATPGSFSRPLEGEVGCWPHCSDWGSNQ